MTFGTIGRLACVMGLSFGSASAVLADPTDDAMTQLRAENTELADLALERQREIVQLKALVEDLQLRLKKAGNGSPTVPAPAGGAVGTATREEELLRRVKELEAENLRLRKAPTPPTRPMGGSSPGITEKNRPQERDVNGTVTDVASDSAFATIDIGSDVGVKAGSELDVYRLDLQNARNSRYLGRLKIVKVETTRAVGTVIPQPGSKPDVRPGDRVGLILVDLSDE